MTPNQSTIALIHGYAFDQRIWQPIEMAFDGFNTILLNLPGFGNDTIEGSYSIEQLATAFWKELDERGTEKVHLVGHSMGGYVCMEMIAQQPDRIASLSLIHSHVFADTEEKKAGRTKVLDEIKADGRSGFVKKMISGLVADKTNLQPLVDTLVHRGMQYSDEAWYNGTLAIRDRNDHSGTLKSLEAPILIIMGEADTAVPVDLGYKQAALAQRCELKVYPAVGHLSMYEHTGQLIADLISFYKTV